MSLKYRVFISALVTLFLTLSCAKAPCQYIPKPECDTTSTVLAPGTYEVVFVATHGSKAGHRTTGVLVLRASREGDVSPRTGETVAESRQHRLWGSIEFDFHEIGAPILEHDTIAPPPNSADPVYPGVLLHEDLRDRFRVFLTIGTVSNLRDDLRTGSWWTDGPGIALHIHCLTETEFSGRWDRWGIIGDGRGYFCAKKMNSK
jgi:hypothetical protein